MAKLRKIIFIMFSTFIILGVFFNINIIDGVYAYESENIKLTSNNTTFSVIDKSSDDVVLVEGKGESYKFKNTLPINNFDQIKYISNANYFLLNV